MPCSRPSALKFAYFLVFLYSAFTLAADTFKSFDETVFVKQLTADGQYVNVAAINALIVLFGGAVLVHIFRIYLSLEMLEGCDNFYRELLGNVGQRHRPIEYLLRVFVVLLISLKIHFRIRDIGSLSHAILIIYASLLAWDLYLVWCKSTQVAGGPDPGKRPSALARMLTVVSKLGITERSFITVSFTGVALGAALALMCREYTTPPIIPAALLLGGMGIIILNSVACDFFRRRNPTYLEFFRHEYNYAFRRVTVVPVVTNECCATRERQP